MKVLMLGWEFPPQISGGLGTACAGLTLALEKQQIDVLFVVPKLHGGEQAERTTFINASSIPIRQKKITINDEQSSDAASDIYLSSPGQEDKQSLHKTRITVELPSILSPYTLPLSSEPAFSLQRWNYSFDVQDDRTLPANLRSAEIADRRTPRHQVKYVKEPYDFSGAYGDKLLEEVERYAQAVAEIARRNSFDIIHAHDWMTFRAGVEARNISGKPLIVHVHATEIDRGGAHGNTAVFEMERQGMLQAEQVVAVSHWTKNIAVHHYHIPAAKIEVIHNGINPKATSSATPTAPPLDAQIVTFLGRITYQKGPMYFVEAARKVHEQFPNVHFVVAGSGDQLPMMIERIAQLRLSDRFHFTGFLKGEDIDRIWAMSNVYVMTSVSEPFGIAPLEAIQAGVPVILSNQAGVSEVMPHAMKVDFWDTGAFAEAICNVLRFKSLANTLRKNGAEEIKHITWDKAAKKLTTLYYELSTKHEKHKKTDPVLPGTPTKKTAHAAIL